MKKIDSKDLAKEIRLSALEMVNSGGSSHIGSILSVTDIVAVLYGSIMKYDPNNPNMVDRDRIILSKGHAGAAIYAALAKIGFFSLSQLGLHCKDGSKFAGHVSHDDIPGIEVSTGSLGHGLSIAAGMAYYAKLKKEQYRVFCVLGDGEMNEGSNWEAISFASHHKLSNLYFVIDKNNLQGCGFTKDVLSMDPLDDKFRAFGCNVKQVDGHSHEELYESLVEISSSKPNAIIATTVKGKGVSFMEGSLEWHYRTPLNNDFDKAISDIQDM